MRRLFVMAALLLVAVAALAFDPGNTENSAISSETINMMPYNGLWIVEVKPLTADCWVRFVNADSNAVSDSIQCFAGEVKPFKVFAGGVYLYPESATDVQVWWESAR